MLLVHKFFIPFIPNENHIGACKFLSYFKYIVCNGNDSQREMYNVHRAHRRTNKLTDVYSCKSFATVGNKACVRWVRVCVCMCVRFTQREQIGSTTMPFRISAFYALRFRSTWFAAMVQAQTVPSTGAMCAVCFKHHMHRIDCLPILISICSKRENWN